MNLFQRIFKKKKEPEGIQSVELVSGGLGSFTAWNGDAYSNDIFRAGVDAIARNAAKLKGSHVVRYGESTGTPDGKLNRLLQVQPNPYMNAFDTLYKMVTQLYQYNNSFALLQRDSRRQIDAIYPLTPTSIDFMADGAGTLYCKFYFGSGKDVTLPYADIIHLRRHFNANDLLGDDNRAMTASLELAHTQNEGIINSIKSSANIRGILHFTQIMAPEKLEEEKNRFIESYLSISNTGGVVATDQKTEYKPIELTPANIDEKQLQAVKDKIFNYLGVSEKIVNSSYSEDDWAAFYESTVEPIATQLSLEFTRKVFNDREQAFGNLIHFDSGRLQFSSNLSKIRLINTLMPYGLLTTNQALEIMNLPPVEGGDKRLQTLNVVDASQANQYQLKANNKELGI